MTTLEPLPRTMRAAVMYAVDDIRIEERPLPALEPGDVLLRMAACGVCGSDMMPWYVKKKAPFVFGHEPAGIVVAVANGAGASGADDRVPRLGERVFPHHHVPCLRCDACAAGRYVHCATWRATFLDPGGMAEYVRIPQANLADTLTIPASLSFADGSLIEPLACVVKSLRRAFPLELRDGVVPADVPAELPLRDRTLYVIGAGVTGLMHVALASWLGATVIASDFNERRLAVARRLGAAATVPADDALEGLRAATGGRFADAVICGPGKAPALAHAVDAVRSDGTVIMFTPIAPEERFAFDQSPAYFRDLRLVASYSCGPDDTRESFRAIERGIVNARLLEAREFAFPAVAEAFAAMAGADVVKAIVTFGVREA
jgi:L-iditol 2-dehydrogenase